MIGVFGFLRGLIANESGESSRGPESFRRPAGNSTDVVGRYFTLSELIERCKQDRDYRGAIAAANAVNTRDPIRRVFSTGENLVIETRQQSGDDLRPPPWWRSGN